MALVTESWGDRHLARMRGLKENDMSSIIYDEFGPVPGLRTCRVCGAVVVLVAQEKHNEWHERVFAPPPDYEPPHSVNFGGGFEEGTGVSVLCPHCGGMNCTFSDEEPRVFHRHVSLHFRCTSCENRFRITFRGNSRWTGMVTKSEGEA